MIGRLLGVSAIVVISIGCSSAGTPQATTGTGGTSGVAGPSSSGGTGAGTGAIGSGGTAGQAVVGEPCDARTQFTVATHDVLNVTWPAGAATLTGSGQVHLWGKIVFTADGNNLTGSIQACGTVLPATTLNPLIGGGAILIDVPGTVWDAPTASHFPVNATQTGWNVGTTVSFTYTALVGFSDPNGATATWPASYSTIAMPNDFDGDMHPGVTGVPRSGAGFLLPPTSAASPAPRADKLYLVDRNVASAMLTRTSCDDASGGSTFTHFDNHLMGCHVSGGAECTPAEVKFIDDNRTIYTVSSATTSATTIQDGATCADVRNKLPM